LRGPLGLDLPVFATAEVESGALTQLNPAELRADLVISLSDGAGPVLAISSVPVISAVEEARKAPELAVLSAMVHGGGAVETAVEVALSAATAAYELGRDRFLLYFGLIRAALSEAARKALEMAPHGVRFFDESQRQSFDRGRATEKAADVIEFLEARGLVVSAAQRERILGTKDLETLTHWVRRAATVASADALFE
jgi:hypothetical protein